MKGAILGFVMCLLAANSARAQGNDAIMDCLKECRQHEKQCLQGCENIDSAGCVDVGDAAMRACLMEHGESEATQASCAGVGKRAQRECEDETRNECIANQCANINCEDICNVAPPGGRK
jgi:hypothetical protein